MNKFNNNLLFYLNVLFNMYLVFNLMIIYYFNNDLIINK